MDDSVRTDPATMRRTYVRAFVGLVLINTITVAAVYVLLLENSGAVNLFAAALLVGVVVTQTVVCRPLRTITAWVAAVPIAVAMAYLVGAHPALDWSGPGEADEMNFAPIYPVITVLYAIGFSLVAGTVHMACAAVRRRSHA